MDESRIYVDFNEMPSANEVLLSKSDTKVDSSGMTIHFVEEMPVSVYMDDQDEHGSSDNLIAEGIARRNHHGGWAAATRWLLVVSERGIHHESEELPHELPEVYLGVRRDTPSAKVILPEDPRGAVVSGLNA